MPNLNRGFEAGGCGRECCSLTLVETDAFADGMSAPQHQAECSGAVELFTKSWRGLLTDWSEQSLHSWRHCVYPQTREAGHLNDLRCQNIYWAAIRITL